MDYRTELITLAEIYCAQMKRSEARVANLAGRDGRFFIRIRAGKSCSVDTLHHVRQWFSDHWPSELEWPRGVARPKPILPPGVNPRPGEAAA